MIGLDFVPIQMTTKILSNLQFFFNIRYIFEQYEVSNFNHKWKMLHISQNWPAFLKPLPALIRTRPEPSDNLEILEEHLGRLESDLG